MILDGIILIFLDVGVHLGLKLVIPGAPQRLVKIDLVLVHFLAFDHESEIRRCLQFWDDSSIHLLLCHCLLIVVIVMYVDRQRCYVMQLVSPRTLIHKL